MPGTEAMVLVDICSLNHPNTTTGRYFTPFVVQMNTSRPEKSSDLPSIAQLVRYRTEIKPRHATPKSMLSLKLK